MGILDIAVSALAFFLLLQQPWLAQSIDFLGPDLAPFFDDLLCGVVPCGKGICKTAKNTTLGYECECDPGWDRVGPEFMPCVIPNCTFDYSCSKALGRGSQGHLSPLDPCFYADCGGGACNSTKFPYQCECDEGYGNLLNTTIFSCVKDCAFGLDCKQLQIPLQNNTVTPNNTNNNSNGGLALSSGNLFLLLIFGISMSVMVSWT